MSHAVILMVFFTSVLQVDGSYFSKFYQLQKTLESALITDETLYNMKQTFFPVRHIHAQEIQQTRIDICVDITVDQALNSTSNDSCIASDDKTGSSENASPLCWHFLWTDSALLSLITIDQLVAFEVIASVIFRTATGSLYYSRHIKASIPIVCPVMPKESDIKTSLMLLLSWVRQILVL